MSRTRHGGKLKKSLTRRRAKRREPKPSKGAGIPESANRLLDYTSGFDVASKDLEPLLVRAKRPFTLWRGVRYNPFKGQNKVPMDRITSTAIDPAVAVDFMWSDFMYEPDQTLIKLQIPSGFPYIPVERTLQTIMKRSGFYPDQQEFVLLPTLNGKSLVFHVKEYVNGSDVSDYAANSAVETWFRRHPEKFKYKSKYQHDYTFVVVEPAYE
jgi:hypothetical protein